MAARDEFKRIVLDTGKLDVVAINCIYWINETLV